MTENKTKMFYHTIEIFIRETNDHMAIFMRQQKHVLKILIIINNVNLQ